MNVHIVLVECIDGYYGDKCHIACGNCLHEKGCDRLNGTCYHGCKDHFKDLKCSGKKVPLFVFFSNSYSKLSNNVSFFKHTAVSLVCEDGFYNSRCNSKCGKCVNNEPCDKVTGECRNGCQLHYEPPLCQGLCL